MNILSLFDGISCGQQALKNLGLYYKYFASEIDKDAIKVTQNNFPQTIQLGDVNNWKSWNLKEINLLIGGSPCQDLSKAKKGCGLNGKKSSIFFKFVDILNYYQPEYFLFENVVTKYADEISKYLKYKPVIINSDLFLPQNRPRLYWTNITINQLPSRPSWENDYFIYSRRDKGWRKNKNGVCFCLLANMGTGGNNVPYYGKEKIKLSPEECEELQGLPIGYTKNVCKTKRYYLLGNGWTVNVIQHIFKSLVY